jgi:hypothetical protein
LVLLVAVEVVVKSGIDKVFDAVVDIGVDHVSDAAGCR